MGIKIIRMEYILISRGFSLFITVFTDFEKTDSHRRVSQMCWISSDFLLIFLLGEVDLKNKG